MFCCTSDLVGEYMSLFDTSDHFIITLGSQGLFLCVPTSSDIFTISVEKSIILSQTCNNSSDYHVDGLCYVHMSSMVEHWEHFLFIFTVFHSIGVLRNSLLQ